MHDGAVRRTFAALLAVLIVTGITGAGRAGPSPDPSGDVASAAREYRASLERLLPFNEADLTRATAARENRRGLLERGIVSRRDVQDAEAAEARARTKLEQTRAQIHDADTLIVEALAAQELARRPRARGLDEHEGTATAFTYFDGHVAWSLALAPRIETFFTTRFGRSLPVSAFGQTRVHDQLGFDHRNALDIAVHPDSVEGQALMAYLRRASISFLAFRGPVPGASTGAHIHVGPASPRLAHTADAR